MFQIHAIKRDFWRVREAAEPLKAHNQKQLLEKLIVTTARGNEVHFLFFVLS